MCTTNRLKNHRHCDSFIQYLRRCPRHYMRSMAAEHFCVLVSGVFVCISHCNWGTDKEGCTQQSRNKIENFENCQRNNILCIKFPSDDNTQNGLWNGAANTHADVAMVQHWGGKSASLLNKYAKTIAQFHIYKFLFCSMGMHSLLWKYYKQRENNKNLPNLYKKRYNEVYYIR